MFLSAGESWVLMGDRLQLAGTHTRNILSNSSSLGYYVIACSVSGVRNPDTSRYQAPVIQTIYKIFVTFVHNGRRKHFDPEMFQILSSISQNYLTPS